MEEQNNNKIENYEIEFFNKKISVEHYLTYSEIQTIVNKIIKEDSWAERETTIDVLLLHFATSLTDDEINSIGHDKLLKSGLISYVRQCVKNFNQVYEAVKYTESTEKALMQIAKNLPDILKPLKDVANRANKSSKK